MHKSLQGNDVRMSECYDDVNFSYEEVVNHIKLDWHKPEAEWIDFERIIISNRTVIKRTYDNEVDIEDLVRAATTGGAFMEKMELPVDYNNYNSE